MQTLDDLLYFEAVVRHGGFAAASRATSIPKSKLSRRVAGLEERLGVRLLERSTRRFAVTAVGEAFYARCRAALAEAEAAEEVAVRLKAEPRGLVRVGCPPGFGERALAGVLPGFFQRYPKVRLQLLVSVDRVDLVEERVDVAFRVGMRPGTDQNLMVRKLGSIRIVLVASPGLLAQHHPISLLDDLVNVPTIAIAKDIDQNLWQLFDRAGEAQILRHEPQVISNDLAVLCQSAIEGVGVALLPEAICNEAIESGRLVRVLPQLHAGENLLHLLFTSRRGMLPAVEAFIDHMIGVLPPLIETSRANAEASGRSLAAAG